MEEIAYTLDNIGDDAKTNFGKTPDDLREMLRADIAAQVAALNSVGGEQQQSWIKENLHCGVRDYKFTVEELGLTPVQAASLGL